MGADGSFMVQLLGYTAAIKIFAVFGRVHAVNKFCTHELIPTVYNGTSWREASRVYDGDKPIHDNSQLQKLDSLACSTSKKRSKLLVLGVNPQTE